MADIILRSISHSYTISRGAADSADSAADSDEYVIRDLNLHWRDGGAYALLGPSGCGKTTLLNIMSGLVQPTLGQVVYADAGADSGADAGADGERDVTELPTRQRNIAQVFQFPVIYDTMTVYQNLAFPLRNRGRSKADIDARVREIAGMLDLTEVLGQRAIELGLDAKQIISLGRGLVREDVAAILFDEPLTVIDPHRKWVLRRKLREIHRALKHTLIYVTHDQTEALTFADEVVVMHSGEVLQQGSPEALFIDPAHTYVGYFIGSPGMNFFPCEIADGAALVAGHAVPLPAPLATRAAQCGGALSLGVRPEHIALAGPGDDGIEMLVHRVEDHGRMRMVAGAVGEHPIKVKLTEAVEVGAGAGATLRIALPPARVRLYEDDRLISAAADLGAAAAEASTTGAGGRDA